MDEFFNCFITKIDAFWASISTPNRGILPPNQLPELKFVSPTTVDKVASLIPLSRKTYFPPDPIQSLLSCTFFSLILWAF